jgi:hypothetical protein
VTGAALALGAGRAGAPRRPVAIVGIALAVALMAWLLLRMDANDSPELSMPHVVGMVGLRDLSASIGHEVYWAGQPSGGVKLELTHSRDGTIYLRYLNDESRVGDGHPSFTTVGTYPVPSAFAVLRQQAKRPAAIVRSLPGGGLAYMNARRPTSVYIAWPGSGTEVEVFDPSPKHALNLVLSGAVAPIR